MDNLIIDKIIKLKDKYMAHEEIHREEFDISLSEYNAILKIGCDDCIKCNEFATNMSLSASRCSRIIEKLIQKGLIKAQRPDGDKRAVILSLTDSGKELRGNLLNLKKTCSERITQNFTLEEIKQMEDSLDMLLKVLL